jgi:hypothetical protein
MACEYLAKMNDFERKKNWKHVLKKAPFVDSKGAGQYVDVFGEWLLRQRYRILGSFTERGACPLRLILHLPGPVGPRL